MSSVPPYDSVHETAMHSIARERQHDLTARSADLRRRAAEAVQMSRRLRRECAALSETLARHRTHAGLARSRQAAGLRGPQ